MLQSDDIDQKRMSHEVFHYLIRAHIHPAHCIRRSVSIPAARVIINIHIIARCTIILVSIAGEQSFDHFVQDFSLFITNECDSKLFFWIQ